MSLFWVTFSKLFSSSGWPPFSSHSQHAWFWSWILSSFTLSVICLYYPLSFAICRLSLVTTYFLPNHRLNITDVNLQEFTGFGMGMVCNSVCDELSSCSAACCGIYFKGCYFSDQREQSQIPVHLIGKVVSFAQKASSDSWETSGPTHIFVVIYASASSHSISGLRDPTLSSISSTIVIFCIDNYLIYERTY